MLQEQKIVDKSCSIAPRLKSSIKVLRGGKIYSVELTSKDCIKLNIGDRVKLYYNAAYDYYYLPGFLKVHLIRFVLSSISLFLVMLPWKLLVSTLVNKKHSNKMR